MKVFTKELTNENVTLTAYLPDPSPEMPQMDKRKVMLVVPGGGYQMCSDREAEPIAFQFLAKGYAAFILRYSLRENSKFPKPLNDAEEAIALIRENAEEWKINPDKIAAVGFSAGGHLVSAVSTMGKVRPNAQILGYPCILEDISRILANPIPDTAKEVDELTPPAFIFSSAEDGCVPINHSLKYAEALDAKKIPFEVHIFSKGYHGFATADPVVYSKPEDYEYNKDCGQWIELCSKWLDRTFGEY